MNTSPLKTVLRLLVLLSLFALLLTAVGAALGQPRDTRCVNDARINNRPPRDCGAPVIVYYQGNAISVLQPNQGTIPGLPILSVQRDTPIPTTGNRMLAEAVNPYNGRNVVLSRLTTGEWQLNTFFADGTPYVIVWYKGFEDVYHLDANGNPMDGAKPIVAPDAPNPSAGAAAAAPAVTTTGTTTVTTATTTTSSGPVISAPVSGCRVTVNRIVRLRTEPNTTSQIIARLPYRTSYTVTEATPGWFRVIYESTQGWVSADFVTATGSCGQ